MSPNSCSHRLLKEDFPLHWVDEGPRIQTFPGVLRLTDGFSQLWVSRVHCWAFCFLSSGSVSLWKSSPCTMVSCLPLFTTYLPAAQPSILETLSVSIWLMASPPSQHVVGVQWTLVNQINTNDPPPGSRVHSSVRCSGFHPRKLKHRLQLTPDPPELAW